MPTRPTNSQVNQFMSMTNCPDKKFASSHLQKFNNNMSNAVNDYFDKNLGARWGPSETTIKKLFKKYADPADGLMKQEGIVNFFQAADVDLASVVPAIFSCEGQAEQMGVYKQAEFVRACQCLNIGSVTDFKKKKEDIKTRYVGDKKLFNKVFKFSFTYMAGGGKYVDRRLCAMMLSALAGKKYPLTGKVVEFLNSDDVRKLTFD